jgi:hypothetical protein
MMKFGLSLLLLLFAPASLLSQAPDAPSSGSVSGGEKSTTNAGAPKPSILPDLDKLQTVAARAATDIGQLHIEKWKTNSSAKSNAQADADSVQHNLKSALPGLIDAVRSAPEDLHAQFKLYRNLNALYDVFGTLTEATRVFGQKNNYEAMSEQLHVIGSSRRKLGEGLEQLTATTQDQLNQLRMQVKDQQEKLATAEAAAAEARKELVLAQNETPKKAAPRKKSVAKKPATAGSNSNANPSSSNANGQPATGAPAPKP